MISFSTAISVTPLLRISTIGLMYSSTLPFVVRVITAFLNMSTGLSVPEVVTPLFVDAGMLTSRL